MLVKIDESLSPVLAEPLREAGHDVRTVIDQGWGGKLDPDLFPLVCEEQAFFITADVGFGDIRQYPPGTHPGILVLRVARESLLEYRDLLASVLQKQSLETLLGTVAVATSRGLRIRRSGRTGTT